MAGKKGKSGRRPGEKLRWHSKPVALAGSYLEVLIEAYMAGVPIPTDKDQVFVLPTKNKMWTGISTGHRKPRRVPWQIQRLLANVAIEYAVQFGAKDSALRCTKREAIKRPTVAQVLRWVRRRAPAVTLRRKASPVLDEREAAYREVEERDANAWAVDR